MKGKKKKVKRIECIKIDIGTGRNKCMNEKPRNIRETEEVHTW